MKNIDDLKIIKKHYGEKMMHLCRDLFPTLLDQEGLLSRLLLDNFSPSRFLYNDIIENNCVDEFKDCVCNLISSESNEVITNKTPQELLSEVGYTLYECKSEDDIQKFKKYYAIGEKLCTFTQGGRLDRCHVFFAVKNNVDEIKRENFQNPERQDEYGTSVISIQFTRGLSNTLSIKNRYNHTVENPDATFSNNLENIIPGLKSSFEKTYNLNINQNIIKDLELPNYVVANNGKYYKYNYEINNIYYCPNNIIIDNFEVKEYPKEKYIILDYFILDLVNKKIELYDKSIKDSFVDTLNNIKRIDIKKENEYGNKEIEIITHDENKIIIEIDKYNSIISYTNNEVREIGHNFLCFNETLENITLENVNKISNNFLSSENVKKINFPKLKEVGDNFMPYCNIKTLYLPNLEFVGDNFLRTNTTLKNLKLPKLKEVGDRFLFMNKALISLSLPELIKVGNKFLFSNISIKNLKLPKLEQICDWFLSANATIETLCLPSVQFIGDHFMRMNDILRCVNLPNALEIGDQFLLFSTNLEYANFPKLETVGYGFLQYSYTLQNLNVPNLISVDFDFLENNITLRYRVLEQIERNKNKEKVKRKNW